LVPPCTPSAKPALSSAPSRPPSVDRLHGCHRKPNITVCSRVPGLCTSSNYLNTVDSRTVESKPDRRGYHWRLDGSSTTSAPSYPLSVPGAKEGILSLRGIHSAGRRCAWHVRLSCSPRCAFGQEVIDAAESLH
jgi:hypothetical protein